MYDIFVMYILNNMKKKQIKKNKTRKTKNRNKTHKKYVKQTGPMLERCYSRGRLHCNVMYYFFYLT